MAMFKQLLIKEIFLLLKSRRTAIYAVTCIILVTGSFALYQQSFQEKFKSRNEVQSVFDKRNHSFNYRIVYFYHRFIQQGIAVTLKPKKLQVFCQGAEAQSVKFFQLGYNSRSRDKYPLPRTELLTNPHAESYPVLDFPLIVTFLLSLLVIISSHNAVSGEREQGTLKLVLANSVSRAKIIFAKLIGGYCIILVPLVFSLVLCLLIAELSSAIGFTAGDIFSTIVIFGLAALYLLVLYILGILVSTLFRSSSTAIAVLVLVWLVFIIVLHNSTLLAVKHQFKNDTVFKVLDQIYKANSDIWTEVDKEAKTRFGQDYDKKKTREIEVWLTNQNMEKLQRNFFDLAGKYVNDLENEYRILKLAGYLSPSILFMTAATEIAGTGVGAYARDIRDMLDYMAYFKNRTIEEMKLDILAEESRWKGKKMIPPIFKSFNKFQPRPSTLTEKLAGVKWNLFGLAIYALLFFMVGFYVFVKTDVV